MDKRKQQIKKNNNEVSMKKKTNIKQVIRKIVREEVAMAIKEVITELKQPTKSQPTKPIKKKSFSKVKMNPTKAEKKLHWKPKYTIEEGLKKTIQWYKANKKQLLRLKNTYVHRP